MKNKTAIDSIISDLKELENNKAKPTYENIMKLLEKYQHKEAKQIREAFKAGAQEGKDIFYIFDYPASRYYQSTYRNSD